MRHPGPPLRRVAVPVHGNADLKRAKVLGIIKQVGMTVDEFAALL